ncbi:hypothetical protein [Streptomyces chryseus]|nr:hypothetical protein [Streptomyces chryseus]
MGKLGVRLSTRQNRRDRLNKQQLAALADLGLPCASGAGDHGSSRSMNRR